MDPIGREVVCKGKTEVRVRMSRRKVEWSESEWSMTREGEGEVEEVDAFRSGIFTDSEEK